MKTTEQKQSVNSLTHTIRRTFSNVNVGGHTYPLITVKAVIKLADECKNGHNDFSITGDIWEGERCNDRTMITAGAIGRYLAGLIPELQIFEDLHLSDVRGVPMYAIGNGFYHLKSDKPETARDYLRLTKEEFETIKVSEDEEYMHYLLLKLGVIERWKNEAKQAIELLEGYTGELFKDNSAKLSVVGGVNVRAIEEKIKSGYYTPAKIKEREDAKLKAENQKILNDLIADRDKEIEKANKEFAVKKSVFDAGLPLDNFIYYNHSNEGHFNWQSYGRKITSDQLSAFIKQVDFYSLPKGIKFELSKKN